MSQFAAVDSTEPRVNGTVSTLKNVELLARLESLLTRAEALETKILAMEAGIFEDSNNR